MHRYQIATNKYRTYCKKDTTGGETELQTEQDRENKRHTYEGGISCHHHIFLEASQCARHLYGSGKKYSPVELKDQCKNMERSTHNGVGRYSLKYKILGRCSAAISTFSLL